MVGYGLLHAVRQRYAALFDEVVNELGMVHHVVVAAELRVLILDGVEAVGARRNNLAHSVGVHQFDVHLGQRLEQVLVAGTAGGVAAATLFLAQDGELDARLLEYLCQRPGDALVAGVERAEAADPVKDLEEGTFGF